MVLPRRRTKNYFAKLNVSTTSFDGAGQRAKWSFNSVGIALLNESAIITDVIQYSFDGVTLHGDLTPTLPSAGIVFDNRFENTVFFRRAAPGAAVVIRVETWQHDA